MIREGKDVERYMLTLNMSESGDKTGALKKMKRQNTCSGGSNCGEQSLMGNGIFILGWLPHCNYISKPHLWLKYFSDI